MNSLESVQALIIAACYSAERSLILSFATRMALDRNLDEAFDKLTQRLLTKETQQSNETHEARPENEDDCLLVRECRIWFGLLILEHMYTVPIFSSDHRRSDYLDFALMEANLQAFD